jgi:hypothetical protein
VNWQGDPRDYAGMSCLQSCHKLDVEVHVQAPCRCTSQLRFLARRQQSNRRRMGVPLTQRSRRSWQPCWSRWGLVWLPVSSPGAHHMQLTCWTD